MTAPYHRLSGLLPLLSLLALAPAAAEESYEQQLLSLIDEQTEIATKTKLNADFVPGIVTVLHGSDLEAKGVRTVGEALRFVPGMEVILDPIGRHQPIVRGIGNVLISGTVKFLINGVAVNTASTGLAEPVFYIPVEQVERIEVVRGPGSAVHGEFAYAGVANVVTRSEERRAFARGGSHGRAGGGVMFDQRLGQGTRMSLNVAGWRSDGADHRVARDFLYDDPQWAQYSHAPGRANEDTEAVSAVFSIGTESVGLQLQHVQDGAGDFWGVNQQLPPERDEIVRRDTFQSARLSGSLDPLPALAARWHLDWRRITDERDDAYVSGHYGVEFYHDRDYDEERRQAGLELEWEPASSQRWLLGLTYSEIDVGESVDIFNGVAYEIIPDDRSRRVVSAWLQDEAKLSEDVTITAGVRYDDYSDVGESVTPRVAAVWRASEKDVFKAQYASAFRPPSFSELLFGSDIEPAEIRTWELGYIRRNPNSLYRATVFHSDLDELIVFNTEVEPGRFENAENATSRGIELEAEVRFGPSLRMDASVSYADTENAASGEPLTGAVEWMGHVGLSYRPVARREWTLVYRHVGDYHREPDDWRGPLDGHDTVDLALNLYDLFVPGLTLRLGVQNLTDTEVLNPAMLSPEADGPHAGPDFERDGRTWWAQAAYSF